MEHINAGTAGIQPGTPVVAGAYTTIIYTYTAGHPVDDTGSIKIVFRHVGDFGIPQFTDPARTDYCSINTTGDCVIEPRWDVKGHTRPWSRALYLKVMKGYLDAGQTIEVIFGDRSGGSPGWRMQTFCEHTFEFRTFVDPIATYEFKQLPESPVLQIIPGSPEKAVVIAPSVIRLNTSFEYSIKLEDRWGNPAAQPEKKTHPGFSEPGIERIQCQDQQTDLSNQSNPIRVIENTDKLQPYWADFHGQSEETVGTNAIEDYYTFARDYAMLDIGAHQGNDFQITDEFWNTVIETADKFNVPGAFVTFPGFEWSGNTPLGGDRNIYFAAPGGKISHSCLDLLPGRTSQHKTSHSAGELFAQLREQADSEPFGFAHVGGRFADISMHDEEIEVAMEIHSAWGTFEWLLQEALERGYITGFCANSDGHKCRPGASYPGAKKFGSYGGLTCVYAEELDRDKIYSALKARHFFATTGNRSLLDVELSAGDKRLAMMGDRIETQDESLCLNVSFSGTGPVECMEVYNGKELLHTESPSPVSDSSPRIKVLWQGSEVRGRARNVEWDGNVRTGDNRILNAVPVNFWNPDRPLQQTETNTIEFASITSGGWAGLILKLEDPQAGDIQLSTLQKNVSVPVKEISQTHHTWDCQGLDKEIRIYRLPAKETFPDLKFSCSLNKMKKGVNPIFVKAIQEDGHAAWSSPIYISQGRSE